MLKPRKQGNWNQDVTTLNRLQEFDRLKTNLEPIMEKREIIELSVLYRISQAVAHRRDISALLQEVFDILEKDME